MIFKAQQIKSGIFFIAISENKIRCGLFTIDVKNNHTNQYKLYFQNEITKIVM